jgi:hypothetical protein
MPTYGMEDFPELGPEFESSEDRESVYDAALRVRTETGMKLSDDEVIGLVAAVLDAYDPR